MKVNEFVSEMSEAGVSSAVVQSHLAHLQGLVLSDGSISVDDLILLRQEQYMYKTMNLIYRQLISQNR